jgi:hypothetical protein
MRAKFLVGSLFEIIFCVILSEAKKPGFYYLARYFTGEAVGLGAAGR